MKNFFYIYLYTSLWNSIYTSNLEPIRIGDILTRPDPILTKKSTVETSNIENNLSKKFINEKKIYPILFRLGVTLARIIVKFLLLKIIKLYIYNISTSTWKKNIFFVYLFIIDFTQLIILKKINSSFKISFISLKKDKSFLILHFLLFSLSLLKSIKFLRGDDNLKFILIISFFQDLKMVIKIIILIILIIKKYKIFKEFIFGLFLLIFIMIFFKYYKKIYRIWNLYMKQNIIVWSFIIFAIKKFIDFIIYANKYNSFFYVTKNYTIEPENKINV